MRRVACATAALLMTGCLDASPGDDKPGGPDASGGTDGGRVATDAGDDPDGGCGEALVDEDFGVPALDGSVWLEVSEGFASVSSLGVSGGELHIDVNLTVSDETARLGVVSQIGRSPTGTSLVVTLDLVTTAGGRAGMGWTTDAGEFVAIYLQGGELVAARGNGASPPEPQCFPCPGYENSAPDRVRLRADADKIIFEAHDADGWDTFASTPNTLDGDPVRAALFGEGTTGDGASGDFADVAWSCDDGGLP